VTTEFDEADKKIIKTLVEVLEEFTEKRATIPVSHIIVLMQIAMDEGHSQKYYSDKWGVPTSTVSSVVLELGVKARQGVVGSGLGLVEGRTSPHSLREHEIHLTVTGRALVKKVVKKLSK
jgi:DNA-binding MarR family transcriptional regulator